jgi:tRNA(Ile)-lysidine synthase
VSFTPERLLRTLEKCLSAVREPAPAGLCLALSGGLDSTVLLVALARLRESGLLPFPMRAVHVDHGLHADSANWSIACERSTAACDVPLTSLRVDARPAPGASPEAAAREARYGALKSELARGEVLLTAHHADDQLETILLQWLRGGGLQAVAGMPGLARFGGGWHARPLLAFDRASLRAWAVHEGLRWIEDPSNVDPRYDRNYLRLRVLPPMLERWPAAVRTAGRIAEFASEALELEREVAAADLSAARQGVTLSLERLIRLPDARQRAVLRAWLRACGRPMPPAATLEALRHDMIAAAPDRIPEVCWPGAVVRRYRGHLYADSPSDRPVVGGEWRAPDAQAWPLEEGGRLELVADVGRGLSRARTPARLRVAGRYEGAEFRPNGGAHRRPLRKWFQDQGVLPWHRDSIPLLCHDDEILACGDLSCAAGYAALPDEPSWCIRWHGRPLLTEAEAHAGNWRETPSID